MSKLALDENIGRDERKRLGKDARKKVPLSRHAKLHLPNHHRNIIANLEHSNKGRLEDLIPIRFGRMLASPFTFYRGSASVMAADLANTAASGFRVQACGDCHIHNFGAFATPERKVVIDINDFDETLPAPWEWDVKRLGASLVLAATTHGFSTDLGKQAAWVMANEYRKSMEMFASMSHLEVWYSHIELDHLLANATTDTVRRREKQLEEAIKKSSPEVLMEKFTIKHNGHLKFKEMPPLLCHIAGIDAGKQEREVFEEYRKTLSDDRRHLLNRFRMADVARKVVGIGSVGTSCGVILLTSGEDDVLILQLKEARASVLEPYAGASRYSHHGERVVNGQKLMQAASDMFLGWTTGKRKPYRQFFVRQLRDIKIGVNTELWTKQDFRKLPRITGEVLARAHARGGDPVAIRAYMGKSEEFEDAIADYSVAYAKQTEADYEHFSKACRSGKLVAVVEQ